ncbi:unnamed protein product [Arabidopsis halleri]
MENSFLSSKLVFLLAIALVLFLNTELSFLTAERASDSNSKVYIVYIGQMEHNDPELVTASHHQMLETLLQRLKLGAAVGLRGNGKFKRFTGGNCGGGLAVDCGDVGERGKRSGESKALPSLSFHRHFLRRTHANLSWPLTVRLFMVQ